MYYDGESEGHPFRGNQYTEGTSGGTGKSSGGGHGSIGSHEEGKALVKAMSNNGASVTYRQPTKVRYGEGVNHTFTVQSKHEAHVESVLKAGNYNYTKKISAHKPITEFSVPHEKSGSASEHHAAPAPVSTRVATSGGSEHHSVTVTRGHSESVASHLLTQHNEPGIHAAAVIARVSGAANKVARVESDLANLTSTHAPVAKGGFLQDNGKYTEDREALHNRILAKLFTIAAVKAATPSEGQKPVMTVLGGRGGSGKSWFTKNGIADTSRAIYINADDLQAQLPGYRGWNAAMYHEEASDLAKRADDIARALHVSVIHDATMRTPGHTAARVETYKKEGYDIHGHYMFVPPQEAAKRALERFVKGGTEGRYVPINYVLNSTTNEQTFDGLKEKMNAWTVYDNTGTSPKLVASGNNQLLAHRALTPAHSSFSSGPTGFVSPNVGSLSFHEAEESVGDERHRALTHASNDIDHKLGIVTSSNRPVLGAWSDGAEHSLMFQMPGATLDQARVAAAMKGYLANQKAVLLFEPGHGGNHFMANFKVSGSLDDVHKRLLDNGLAFHTIESTSHGAIVHVFGMDDDTMEAVGKAASAENSQVEMTFGTGEFIGTHKEDGTDAEQRADARQEYQKIIDDVAARPDAAGLRGRDVAGAWNSIRNRWSQRLRDQELEAAG